MNAALGRSAPSAAPASGGFLRPALHAAAPFARAPAPFAPGAQHVCGARCSVTHRDMRVACCPPQDAHSAPARQTQAEASPSPGRTQQELLEAASSQATLLASLKANAFYKPRRQALDLLSLAGCHVDQKQFQVYVILFVSGIHDTEGIYSLKATDVRGLPVETILAFQDTTDAQRYASLLESTMEPFLPQVVGVPAAEIIDFCSEHEYRCQLELTGSCLMPPEYCVSMTDWERSQRLRDGDFAVLESEPSLAGEAPPPVTATATASLDDWSDEAYYSAHFHPGVEAWRNGTAAGKSNSLMGPPELEALRRQLEELLPPPDDPSDGDDPERRQ